MHFKAVLLDIMECMIPVDISDMCLTLVVVWDRWSMSGNKILLFDCITG